MNGETVTPAVARNGVSWRYWSRDCAAALGEIAAGRLALLDYLRSLQPSSASAVFAWDDPWPAVFDLPLSTARVAARWLIRRGRDTTAAELQSAKLHP